jgi:phenylacetate-CoA ligase
MAYETPERDGLHLCDDLTYVEFLDRDGKPAPAGTPGRVIVTDLMAKVMPFIRYDQGDLAVYGRAREGNGIGSRRLLRILGRDDDYAILPDGTRRTRYDFAPLLNPYHGVLQYRVVQRTLTDFEVQLVAEHDYVDGIRADILRRFQDAFPPELCFVIVQRDRLEPDLGGKLRVLVSEVVQ